MPPSEIKQDIAEIKSSLNFICKTLEDVKTSNEKNEKSIIELLKALKEKDERIYTLETKFNELEQYSRKKTSW